MEAKDTFQKWQKGKTVKQLGQKTEIKCHMSNTTEIPESRKESGKRQNLSKENK